tara:strand:+ start:3381 stop:5537 length:2157 start_codon:yes stop_codon:yes gene_type:complete
MSYGINGTLVPLQDPMGDGTTSLNRVRNWAGSYANIWSANHPIVHSVLWNIGLTEAQEPLASNFSGSNGDVVNVIFDVYQCLSTEDTTVFPDEWTLVSSIRKSRDIRNISLKDKINGGDGAEINYGHIFTVDISEVCKDLLSYSLLPHGKGTYTDYRYGGLNGGAKQQDNLAQPVWSNNFILTKNGAYRKIQVRYRTEIIDGGGIVREATNAGSYLNSFFPYTIINSAGDFDTNNPAGVWTHASLFMHLGWGASPTYCRQAQSLAPNFNYSSIFNQGQKLAKDVRMTENVESLYWTMGTISNYGIWSNPTSSPNPENLAYSTSNTSDLVENAFMNVRAFDASGALVRTARLYDWNQNLIPKTSFAGGNAPNPAGVTNCWPRKQMRSCVQNISPVFINANCIHVDSAVQDIWENGGETYTRRRIDVDGATSDAAGALFLNDEIAYYSVSGTTITTTQGNGQGIPKDNVFEFRWYKIDRDRSNQKNYSNYYEGIYYTELRGDYATNSKKIRCKGINWENMEVPYFRVHWLNKAGGIDSYTFKGDTKISYNASRDIILRPEPRGAGNVGYGQSYSTAPSPYPSNNAPTTGSYQSDTMRGGDVYHGGLEVLNVDSTKSGMFSSLPLNERKANWLREIVSSPNVWTERITTDVTNVGTFFNVAYRSIHNIETGSNMDGRTPSNTQYVPIIITNSSVDIFDTAKGLTTMSFEYTHAHAVVTQRN